MTLPKHLRPRWRYVAVAVECWPDADPSRSAFQRAVRSAARALLGDPGTADARLDVVDVAVEDGAGRAVVRVRRGEVEAARAALACVTSVDGQPVGTRVVGVSGTLRACRRRYWMVPESETTTVGFGGRRRRATVRRHGSERGEAGTERDDDGDGDGGGKSDGDGDGATPDWTAVVDLYPETEREDEAFTGATAEDVER